MAAKDGSPVAVYEAPGPVDAAVLVSSETSTFYPSATGAGAIYFSASNSSGIVTYYAPAVVTPVPVPGDNKDYKYEFPAEKGLPVAAEEVPMPVNVEKAAVDNAAPKLSTRKEEPVDVAAPDIGEETKGANAAPEVPIAKVDPVDNAAPEVPVA